MLVTIPTVYLLLSAAITALSIYLIAGKPNAPIPDRTTASVMLSDAGSMDIRRLKIDQQGG